MIWPEATEGNEASVAAAREPLMNFRLFILLIGSKADAYVGASALLLIR